MATFAFWKFNISEKLLFAISAQINWYFFTAAAANDRNPSTSLYDLIIDPEPHTEISSITFVLDDDSVFQSASSRAATPPCRSISPSERLQNTSL